MEFKTVMSGVSLMSVDTDCNIWYAKGGEFCKIPLVETEYEKLFKRNFSANLNYARQTINISGKFFNNSRITVRIVDAEDNIVMFDQIEKNADNSFSAVYRLNNFKKGVYKIYLDGEKLSEPYLYEILATPVENAVLIESVFENGDRILKGVELSNYYGNTEDISVIAAVYNSDRTLADVKRAKRTVLSLEFEYFELGLEKKENKEIKIYVWKEGLIPLNIAEK